MAYILTDLELAMCRMWVLVSWLLIPATLCHYPGQLPTASEPEDPEDREKAIEQEKLRKEAIREAEEKRRIKHKKLEEEREGVRQNIRDKVSSCQNSVLITGHRQKLS